MPAATVVEDERTCDREHHHRKQRDNELGVDLHPAYDGERKHYRDIVDEHYEYGHCSRGFEADEHIECDYHRRHRECDSRPHDKVVRRRRADKLGRDRVRRGFPVGIKQSVHGGNDVRVEPVDRALVAGYVLIAEDHVHSAAAAETLHIADRDGAAVDVAHALDRVLDSVYPVGEIFVVGEIVYGEDGAAPEVDAYADGGSVIARRFTHADDDRHRDKHDEYGEYRRELCESADLEMFHSCGKCGIFHFTSPPVTTSFLRKSLSCSCSSSSALFRP